MYKLLRSFLFRFGPEKVHSFSMKALQIACRSGVGEKLLAAAFRPKVEPVKFFGLSFPNRVGPVSYTHLDVYKRQCVFGLLTFTTK